ncbi:MAG TPA: hypothetical protein VL242_22985, partial [Sorangium sp.]|nr:hypothetical protein [Sorangium sp.]
ASGAGRSPAASIRSGGVGVALGPEIAVHGAVLCDAEAPCAALGAELRAARDARAEDFATRLIGFGAVLERVAIAAEGKALHARVKLSAEEAGVLVDRLASLRGLRQPAQPPAPALPPARDGGGAPRGDAGAPPTEEVVAPRKRSADAGAPPTEEVVAPRQRARPDGGAP